MKKKRIASILMASIMAASLAACGSSAASNSSQSSSAVTSSAGADASAVSSVAGTAGVDTTVSGSVTGSGSSALFPLAQDAATEYKKLNKNVSITMNAGGSGTGLKQVFDGSVDIGNSDVDASEKLDADQAKQLVDHKVCVITMAPVVNKDVTKGGVKNLTSDQIKDIFTGKTKNWKSVGGPDEDIVLVTRPQSSGTRALFKEYALGGEEEASNSALETDDSGTLLQSVSGTKGAIGYVALSYLVSNKDVDTLSIDGVEPTLENTYSGKWNVWGYEHMYTKGEAKGAVKAFIDYISSDQYAGKMEQQGYCVTSKMQVKR